MWFVISVVLQVMFFFLFVGESCVYIVWSRFLLFLLFHSLTVQYPYQVGRLGEGEEAAGSMALGAWLVLWVVPFSKFGV